MRLNEHVLVLNMSGKKAEILIDNKEELDIIIACPNCGQPTRYGSTRMISGYVGCDSLYKGGSCYFDDLRPRVMVAHSSANPEEREKYVEGLLYNKEKVSLTIKKLNPTDQQAVQEMDKQSDNDVLSWIDSEMAYGLFRNEELIGYLTMGYADDLPDEVESHPHYHSDARILSNAFIKEDYRGNDFGYFFIHQVLDSIYEVTFLSLMNPEIASFYRRLGFEFIHENTMSRLTP